MSERLFSHSSHNDIKKLSLIISKWKEIKTPIDLIRLQKKWKGRKGPFFSFLQHWYFWTNEFEITDIRTDCIIRTIMLDYLRSWIHWVKTVTHEMWVDGKTQKNKSNILVWLRLTAGRFTKMPKPKDSRIRVHSNSAELHRMGKWRF